MAPDFEEVWALKSSTEDNNDADAQSSSKQLIHLISSCQFLALSFPGLPLWHVWTYSESTPLKIINTTEQQCGIGGGYVMRVLLFPHAFWGLGWNMI